MKKQTITIGIPAYNEESNIGFLIRDILAQKISTFELSKIIVASDGSTDKTVDVVRSFKNKRIQVIQSKQRKGKSARQNELIKESTSDVLVLLDADIVIKDRKFLEKMLSPILANECDMTSSGLKELTPKTFFEKALAVSMKLKVFLFNEFKEGNNVYNCHGPARAFGKNVYNKLTFKQSTGEDMYSYLFCVKIGKRFKYVKNAQVEYKLPSTPTDHYKQSKRYLDAFTFNEKIFGKPLMNSEMVMSPKVYFKAFKKALPYILSHLVFVVAYVFILIGVHFAKTLRFTTKESWSVASSKSIRT